MSENRSGSECFFERVESIMTGGVKFPGNILLGKAYQWNDNIQIVKDELAIKISKI